MSTKPFKMPDTEEVRQLLKAVAQIAGVDDANMDSLVERARTLIGIFHDAAVDFRTFPFDREHPPSLPEGVTPAHGPRKTPLTRAEIQDIWMQEPLDARLPLYRALTKHQVARWRYLTHPAPEERTQTMREDHAPFLWAFIALGLASVNSNEGIPALSADCIQYMVPEFTYDPSYVPRGLGDVALKLPPQFQWHRLSALGRVLSLIAIAFSDSIVPETEGVDENTYYVVSRYDVMSKLTRVIVRPENVHDVVKTVTKEGGLYQLLTMEDEGNSWTNLWSGAAHPRTGELLRPIHDLVQRGFLADAFVLEAVMISQQLRVYERTGFFGSGFVRGKTTVEAVVQKMTLYRNQSPEATRHLLRFFRTIGLIPSDEPGALWSLAWRSRFVIDRMWPGHWPMPWATTAFPKTAGSDIPWQKKCTLENLERTLPLMPSSLDQLVKVRAESRRLTLGLILEGGELARAQQVLNAVVTGCVALANAKDYFESETPLQIIDDKTSDEALECRKQLERERDERIAAEHAREQEMLNEAFDPKSRKERQEITAMRKKEEAEMTARREAQQRQNYNPRFGSSDDGKDEYDEAAEAAVKAEEGEERGDESEGVEEDGDEDDEDDEATIELDENSMSSRSRDSAARAAITAEEEVAAFAEYLCGTTEEYLQSSRRLRLHGAGRMELLRYLKRCWRVDEAARCGGHNEAVHRLTDTLLKKVWKLFMTTHDFVAIETKEGTKILLRSAGDHSESEEHETVVVNEAPVVPATQAQSKPKASKAEQQREPAKAVEVVESTVVDSKAKPKKPEQKAAVSGSTKKSEAKKPLEPHRQEEESVSSQKKATKAKEEQPQQQQPQQQQQQQQQQKQLQPQPQKEEQQVAAHPPVLDHPLSAADRQEILAAIPQSYVDHIEDDDAGEDALVMTARVGLTMMTDVLAEMKRKKPLPMHPTETTAPQLCTKKELLVLFRRLCSSHCGTETAVKKAWKGATSAGGGLLSRENPVTHEADVFVLPPEVAEESRAIRDKEREAQRIADEAEAQRKAAAAEARRQQTLLAARDKAEAAAAPLVLSTSPVSGAAAVAEYMRDLAAPMYESAKAKKALLTKDQILNATISKAREALRDVSTEEAARWVAVLGKKSKTEPVLTHAEQRRLLYFGFVCALDMSEVRRWAFDLLLKIGLLSSDDRLRNGDIPVHVRHESPSVRCAPFVRDFYNRGLVAPMEKTRLTYVEGMLRYAGQATTFANPHNAVIEWPAPPVPSLPRSASTTASTSTAAPTAADSRKATTAKASSVPQVAAVKGASGPATKAAAATPSALAVKVASKPAAPAGKKTVAEIVSGKPAPSVPAKSASKSAVAAPAAPPPSAAKATPLKANDAAVAAAQAALAEAESLLPESPPLIASPVMSSPVTAGGAWGKKAGIAAVTTDAFPALEVTSTPEKPSKKAKASTSKKSTAPTSPAGASNRQGAKVSPAHKPQQRAAPTADDAPSQFTVTAQEEVATLPAAHAEPAPFFVDPCSVSHEGSPVAKAVAAFPTTTPASTIQPDAFFASPGLTATAVGPDLAAAVLSAAAPSAPPAPVVSAGGSAAPSAGQQQAFLQPLTQPLGHPDRISGSPHGSFGSAAPSMSTAALGTPLGGFGSLAPQTTPMDHSPMRFSAGSDFFGGAFDAGDRQLSGTTLLGGSTGSPVTQQGFAAGALSGTSSHHPPMGSAAIAGVPTMTAASDPFAAFVAPLSESGAYGHRQGTVPMMTQADAPRLRVKEQRARRPAPPAPVPVCSAKAAPQAPSSVCTTSGGEGGDGAKKAKKPTDVIFSPSKSIQHPFPAAAPASQPKTKSVPQVTVPSSTTMPSSSAVTGTKNTEAGATVATDDMQSFDPLQSTEFFFTPPTAGSASSTLGVDDRAPGAGVSRGAGPAPHLRTLAPSESAHERVQMAMNTFFQ